MGFKITEGQKLRKDWKWTLIHEDSIIPISQMQTLHWGMPGLLLENISINMFPHSFLSLTEHFTYKTDGDR